MFISLSAYQTADDCRFKKQTTIDRQSFELKIKNSKPKIIFHRSGDQFDEMIQLEKFRGHHS